MSSVTAVLPARLERVVRFGAAARTRLLAVRTAYVLSAFVVFQWITVAALALTVRHNGWIYYMGGDQLWHYTGAYVLVHGKLAPTLVGIGWSTILAPIAAIAGPNLASALPAIILFNTLVLLPLGLFCLYGIAERIAGRLFGYWAVLLWIVIPFVGIRYALQGYHQKWTELTLPQLFGLGAMSDYPSMIAIVVGAYLCLRALDERHWIWAAGAGFAVGYSLAVKPSNAVFLVAPALLFLAFRVRLAIPFVLGLLPCLAALAFWKVKGRGNLPWRTSEPARRIALGPHGIVHRYLHNNTWTQFQNNLLQIGEHLWSKRLLEFLVIAGLLALIVRSRRGAIFVGAWFVVFLLLKATYVDASVESGSFWRLMMPAFPAFVVIVAAIPLLVPGLRARAGTLEPWRVPRRLVAGVGAGLVAVLAIFPIALVAAAKDINGPRPAAFVVNSILIPQSGSLHPAAAVSGGTVRLTWTSSRSVGGTTFYAVFRNHGHRDVFCGPVKNAPGVCEIFAQELGTPRATSFVDSPGPGTWIYRVGIVANWLDNLQYGDVYTISTPVVVTVP